MVDGLLSQLVQLQKFPLHDAVDIDELVVVGEDLSRCQVDGSMVSAQLSG